MNINDNKDRLNNFLKRHDDLYMVMIAVLIGVLAGYGNLLFRFLIGFVQDLFYGTKSEYVLATLNQTPFYKIIFVPAIGGLLVGLISIVFKFAKGHGVPDVMKL